jgi:protein-L-isoaspartate(D-aspartate) O-methyltransferase
MPIESGMRVNTVGDLHVQEPAQAASLREAMVRELREQGAIRSEPVAAALATVPRHLFAPGEPLEAAYAPQGIVMAKRGPDGRALSVMSAAHLQAVMLEQAGIEPGMRVLEVGSGGYNAALIQEIVGSNGQVTTVDIDADITDRARACLAAAGYNAVKVVLADAERGVPEGGPYDRTIVTAAAWDIPPAWIAQLTEQGRLVVPLRLRDVTRSIAFDRDGECLVSRNYCLARFVPVQGQGAHEEFKVVLGGAISLETDDAGMRLDAAALAEALDTPPLECWSGAAWDLPDELELFVTISLPRIARLCASQQVIDQGLIAPAALMGVTALIGDDSFAYRTRRPNESTGGYESGVIAHGPQAGSLAEQYADLLRRWARDHRRRGEALFRYLPKGTAPVPLPQGTVTKRHGAVTVSWP